MRLKFYVFNKKAKPPHNNTSVFGVLVEILVENVACTESHNNVDISEVQKNTQPLPKGNCHKI